MKLLKYLLPFLFLFLIGTKPPSTVITCGPTIAYKLGASITSVQDGDWYDPKTWGGTVPSQNDVITFSHNLTSSKNIVITGKLTSRGGSITFTGINEAGFTGGGEDIINGDIGLWIMGAGILDLQGENKTRGSPAVSSIKSGDISFQVKEATNWRAGDDIVISRTAKTAIDDDVRKIVSVQGTKITVDRALGDHPMINGMWTAEVLNLSSNLTIQGTASGYSHVFIRSTQPQNIQNVRLRYLGPRKNLSGGPEKEFVRGRYGIHFHHCMNGSIGSQVINNAFWQCNSHCIVPHVSDGVTAAYNVMYDVMETPLWFDFGDETNGVTYSHNIMGKIAYTVKAVTAEDASTTEFGAGSVLLAMGDNNTCTYNISFGISGQVGIDGTGDYQWRNNDERGHWRFVGNMSHHGNGGSVWQNTAQNHTIEDFTAYYCRLGWFQGAYANVYGHKGGTYYDNPILVRAGSLTSLRLRFEGMTIINGGPGYGDTKDITAGIIQVGSPLATIDQGSPPVLYRGIKFVNCKNEIVLAGGEQHHDADVVDCGVLNPIVRGNEKMRVQQNGTAYELTSAGKRSIPLFAPTVWGNGDGVKVEYFNDVSFKLKVAEAIEPQINFSEWKNLGKAHHLLTSTKYSVRFSGQLQPQYTDNYTFSAPADAGGSSTLFINGAQVKGSMSLKQGQLYDYRIDFISSGSEVSGLEFRWYCPQMDPWHKGGEVVPQSQLYTTTVTPPPPVNKPPISNAGPDLTITLPDSLAKIIGSATDPDGFVTTYSWTQLTGTAVNITGANSSQPTAGPLKEGKYSFRLSVTDNQGSVAFDDVNVTVVPKAVPNKPPTATGTSSKVIFATITLSGNGSDPEGGIISYQWTRVSGHTVTILNGSQKIATVQNAPAGSYIFRLTVTDDKGAKSSIDIPVVI
jgi:hypothetical protein